MNTININYRVSQYKKTIPIQGINMNTRKRYRHRERYEYRKTVPIQGIGTNTGKQYIFEKQYE